MPRSGEGPPTARIMLVGESWSFEDERACEPFQGESGKELNRVLHEAGIMRSECYLTNLVNARAPQGNLLHSISQKKTDQDRIRREMGGDFLRDRVVSRQILQGYARLRREIEAVQPNVIVALGNSVLWALTGAWGIEKWRGSMLKTDTGRKLIPTYASWSIMSQWDKRAIMVHDLKRAREESIFPTYNNEPQWNFIIRPRFQVVIDTLNMLLEWLEATPPASEFWIDLDLETRAGHIACAGLSWSRTDAVVIPLMCVEDREGYWSFEEEVQIVYRLWRVLTHTRVAVRWQNGLYDAQYTWRHWHFIPRGRQDTMIAQHTAFVALPKSLAFQSSMYSPHYVYWKDDGATWHLKASEETLWAYNAQDCVRTREVGEAETQIIKQLGLEEVDAFQQRFFYPVLQAMLDGVLIDKQVQRRLDAELLRGIETRQRTLDYLLGLSLNINSPKQMCDVFYNVLQQPPIKTRAKKGVPGHLTCDDEALQLIGKREPILRPIVTLIADIRTMRVLLSTFARAKVDADGRMRCSFNIGGNAKTEDSGQQAIAEKSAPYTYRLSSSKNAFGGGCNFQNIPSDKSKSIGKAKARGTTFSFPNMRSMYIPDPGMEFFDGDLDRADMQIVAWEADDPLLKAALKLGADVHLLNVYAIDGVEPPPLEELVETHPKYMDHRGPRKHKREFAKVFGHATDYLGKARTVAAGTGRTVHEIERAQRAYFARYPGIERWQKRVIEQVTRHHFVENIFGYRWHLFARLDDTIMPAAVAWIPQSAVGCLINRIWMNIYNNAPGTQVLGQVHDSLFGQFPQQGRETHLKNLAEAGRIIIPYEDPLIIPFGIKTSEVSWGDCK